MGELMSINAARFLKRIYVGSELLFSDQVVAEIVQPNSHIIKIRDIHGKYWSINQEGLRNVIYHVFMENLAETIARSHPKNVSQTGAQKILNNMNVGDELHDQQGFMARLVEIDKHNNLGPSLVFQDVNENHQQVFLNLIPYSLDFKLFLKDFRWRIKRTAESTTEPILLQYFKNEFIPKMLAQMDYDNKRWGDSWLFEPLAGQEKSISEHVNEYFDFHDQLGKKVPWLKVAGYAIIAQAREDHPEWLM
jgi:hypothetical protein